MSQSTDTRKLILLLGDLVAFYISLFAVLFIRYAGLETGLPIRIHALPFSILFFFWAIVFYILGLYEIIRSSAADFIQRILLAFTINALVGVILFYFIPFFGIAPKLNLFAVLALSAMLVIIWRQIIASLFKSIPRESVLFLGITDEVLELASALKKNVALGYRVTEIMDDAAPIPENLKEFVLQDKISLVVVSPQVAANGAIAKRLVELIPLGVRIANFAKFYEENTGRIPISLITEQWFLENPMATKRLVFDLFKRLVDIIAALILLIPTALATPILAILIRLDSPGPIFYGQTRVGRYGRLFKIYKFRSMIADAEQNGAKWAGENDPRVTRVGKFLRVTRIDELPQLIAVLQGNLSFVGPRPERPEFVEPLRKEIPFYDIRHIALPGLTGWAQINPPYYYASVQDAYKKLQYELYYIAHRSIALDLLILLKTIAIVISRAGR
ncbi:MAG: sugar transferase [Candidatus Sungbacteria bacterium]|uniref:Sugar transferase n=1 Tax=Candidatus Sungiibacteriota bacterium TaxID=2750080 RepID=A0A9D6LQJ5_9BACT|nr:sugar transferase [Candidatus Sungbacteria bacterium]